MARLNKEIGLGKEEGKEALIEVKELRKKISSLEELLDSLEAPIIHLDTEGKVLRCNRAMLVLLGVAKVDEFRGQKWVESMVAEGDRDAALEVMGSCTTGALGLRMLVKLRHLDPQIREISLAIRFIPLEGELENRVSGLLLVPEQPLDSGEQDRLRAAEEHAMEMEAVLDDLPAPVWEVAIESLELNRSNAAAGALSPSPQYGVSFLSQAVDPIGHPSLEEAFQKVRKGETMRGVWVPMLGVSGSYPGKVISVLMRPSLGNDGRIVAVVIMGEGPGGSRERAPELFGLDGMAYGCDNSIERVLSWRSTNLRRREEILLSAKGIFQQK